MADEKTAGIQNKWLLVIAVVLGALVVVIYNAHIRAIRNEKAGQFVEIVVMKKDIKADGRIKEKNIEKLKIPAISKEAVEKYIKWKDRDFLFTVRVNQPLSKGQYLMWEHVQNSGGSNPSNTISEGMLVIPVEFESSQSLGDMLSVGDHVNLKGVFAINGGQPKTERIIRYVRVLNIGGRGAGDVRGRDAGGMKSYRKITVEVPEDVSLQLSNVFTHMIGPVQLELCGPGRGPLNAGQVNPKLSGLAERANLMSSQGSRGAGVR